MFVWEFFNIFNKPLSFTTCATGCFRINITKITALIIPNFGESTVILNPVDTFSISKWCKLNFKLLRGHVKLRHITANLLKGQAYFCVELLSENYFEAVLTTFCCYDHGAKAFEAVHKIATDQEEYRKCSSCFINCWISKIYTYHINE